MSERLLDLWPHVNLSYPAPGFGVSRVPTYFVRPQQLVVNGDNIFLQVYVRYRQSTELRNTQACPQEYHKFVIVGTIDLIGLGELQKAFLLLGVEWGS